MMPSLEDFFKSGRSIKLTKGEMVLRGDETIQDIFYLSKGVVKVFSINDQGEEYVHVIYKAQEIFPLIWAFRDRQRRIFYEAISDVVLWKVPKERFVRHIKEGAKADTFALIEQLVEQFNIYADRIDNLQYRAAKERVVYRLLFLAGRFGKKSGSQLIIEAPLTHRLIASSINLTRESVSREIEALTKAGIIDSENGKIVIKDIKKLSQQFSEPISLDLWGLQ